MGSDVEVTQADREKAREFVADIEGAPTPEYRDDVERDIAQALADERAKSRAPFLAVADEIHERGTAEVQAMDDEPDEHRKNQCASRAATYARAEHLVRRAAEEG